MNDSIEQSGENGEDNPKRRAIPTRLDSGIKTDNISEHTAHTAIFATMLRRPFAVIYNTLSVPLSNSTIESKTPARIAASIESKSSALLSKNSFHPCTCTGRIPFSSSFV